jgi:TIR domain
MTAVPLAYLAHASEEKTTLAVPLAEKLRSKGIDVWLDRWEIRYGDSLLQKMDEGLVNCTHFLVLLTPTSLTKEWVKTEIDAGFMRAVEKQSRFIGLRIGVTVNELPPLIKSRNCPELNLHSQEEVDRLIADILGVSQRPPLGPQPSYIASLSHSQREWSQSTMKAAEYLVKESKHGMPHDPITNYTEVARKTGLPEENVRLSVLELKEAGLIQRRRGTGDIWPSELFL